MKRLFIAVVLAVMLSLFGSTMLQTAGDILPGDNGSLQIYVAGDILPGDNG